MKTKRICLLALSAWFVWQTSALRSQTFDFNDGTTSAEQNPTHTFTTGAAYDVKLTVTRDSASDTSTQVVKSGGYISSSGGVKM